MTRDTVTRAWANVEGAVNELPRLGYVLEERALGSAFIPSTDSRPADLWRS